MEKKTKMLYATDKDFEAVLMLGKVGDRSSVETAADYHRLSAEKRISTHDFLKWQEMMSWLMFNLFSGTDEEKWKKVFDGIDELKRLVQERKRRYEEEK